MSFALAVFVVVGFAATIEYFDLPDRARTVGERSSRSLAVLRDDSLGDREKEKALQSQSRELFRLLGILARQSHQHRKDFHCRSKLALEPIRSTDWDFSYSRMALSQAQSDDGGISVSRECLERYFRGESI